MDMLLVDRREYHLPSVVLTSKSRTNTLTDESQADKLTWLCLKHNQSASKHKEKQYEACDHENPSDLHRKALSSQHPTNRCFGSRVSCDIYTDVPQWPPSLNIIYHLFINFIQSYASLTGCKAP
ncbi:hypothetical protein QQF64_025423 [Cirrhinus molitorella]|uniref:Uncharacterized protein n=1 Tax=Cirrhinus molitorella TaxID=172907 RepID=A0ABR3NPD7_9TELE